MQDKRFDCYCVIATQLQNLHKEGRIDMTKVDLCNLDLGVLGNDRTIDYQLQHSEEG